MALNCFLRRFPSPTKVGKGDGNGADDNRVRAGKGWDKQDVRVM